jgi:hypothetical protein
MPVLCGCVSCGPSLFVFGLASCVFCSRFSLGFCAFRPPCCWACPSSLPVNLYALMMPGLRILRPGGRADSWLGCGVQGCCCGAGLPARVFRPLLCASVGGVVRVPRGSGAVVASLPADHAVQDGDPGLSQDAFIWGSSAWPCAVATRLWAGPAWMPLLGCPAGPCCAASLVNRQRWSEVVRSCLLDGRLG